MSQANESNGKAEATGALIELVDIRKVYQMGTTEVNALAQIILA